MEMPRDIDTVFHDVIGRITIERDLVVKPFGAEGGLDPDLGPSVARLNVSRLSTLRAISLHIAAFRLRQRIGFGPALTHHSPKRRDRRVIGVERVRSIFLSDPDLEIGTRAAVAGRRPARRAPLCAQDALY